jgi:heme oxygenase
MVPLKEAIEEKHRQAEQMEFTQRMMRGELNRFEYSRYLFQLYAIFSAMERFPLPHPDLTRTTKIVEDIRELNPGAAYYLNTCPSTLEYISHLHTLSQEELLPHVYLNYLALMFGGQMMMDKVPGSGRIYDFANMKAAMMAIRAIQKDEWAEEANVGLDYNIRIYHELQNPVG